MPKPNPIHRRNPTKTMPKPNLIPDLNLIKTNRRIQEPVTNDQNL